MQLRRGPRCPAIHRNIDPRNAAMPRPGQPGQFEETLGFRHGLQAGGLGDDRLDFHVERKRSIRPSASTCVYRPDSSLE